MKKTTVAASLPTFYIYGVVKECGFLCCLNKQTQQVMKEMGWNFHLNNCIILVEKHWLMLLLDFGGFVRVLLYLRMVWFY